MTRQQRHWHLWLWLTLAPLLAAGLIFALAARPALDDQPIGEGERPAKEVVP